jgi:succinoglycan biosynthesis transport protein ExoP
MERQLGLRDVWQILWRRKLWLLLPVVVVTAVAFAGSFLLPVVYESSTKIVISTTKLVSPELERMLPTELGGLPSNRLVAQNWLASTRSEITSTDYINTLISDLNLRPGDKIVENAAKMREQFPEYDLSEIVRKLQIDELRDNISVSMIGQNQIIITCRSSKPKQANEMATKLAQVYREKKLAEEVRGVRDSQLFTDQQLALAQKEYDDAEQRLVQFKNSYIAGRLEKGVSSQQNLDQIDAEVDATRLEISEATDRRNFLLANMVAAGVDSTKATGSIPGLQGYVDDALESAKEISQLMNKYMWSDAKIQSVQTKVGGALDDLRSAANAAAATYYPDQASQMESDIGEFIYRRYELRFLTGKEKLLREATDDMKRVLADSPYYDQMVDNLQRKVDAKKDTYEKWQKQAAGIKILQATTAAEAENKYRILEPASIPLRPAAPNRTKITVMGLALGILLGCCAVVIAELLDHSIRSVEDVEALLGMEVVGTIPKIEAVTRARKITAR